MTIVEPPTNVGSSSHPPANIRTKVRVPLRFADGYETVADLFTFFGLADGKEHIALGLGDYEAASAAGTALVRPHSECLTGDVFGSLRCDCGPQLREAVEQIAIQGGFLLYLRQEGRGIGLYEKLDAYALQDRGFDTYQANRELGFADDERDYTSAAQMLVALGVPAVELLSNNPDKTNQLTKHGIIVSAVRSTGVHASASNVGYLAAKVSHTNHNIDLSGITIADIIG